MKTVKRIPAIARKRRLSNSLVIDGAQLELLGIGKAILIPTNGTAKARIINDASRPQFRGFSINNSTKDAGTNTAVVSLNSVPTNIIAINHNHFDLTAASVPNEINSIAEGSTIPVEPPINTGKLTTNIKPPMKDFLMENPRFSKSAKSAITTKDKLIIPTEARAATGSFIGNSAAITGTSGR